MLQPKLIFQIRRSRRRRQVVIHSLTFLMHGGQRKLKLDTEDMWVSVSHVTETCWCFSIGRFHVVFCLHLTHFWPLLSQNHASFRDTFWPVWDALGRPGTLQGCYWVTRESKNSRGPLESNFWGLKWEPTSRRFWSNILQKSSQNNKTVSGAILYSFGQIVHRVKA